jgi:hypothetical protein
MHWEGENIEEMKDWWKRITFDKVWISTLNMQSNYFILYSDSSVLAQFLLEDGRVFFWWSPLLFFPLITKILPLKMLAGQGKWFGFQLVSFPMPLK